MDEYYCPNCGAILNDQYGFDPSCGAWTCTECGKLLVDDDIYEGDSFEGVAWFCDDCGALLNRQSGFSDSYSSWTCTECGHLNGITEDDILEEDDGPECPKCGAKLKNQFCYADYQDDWKCMECGAHLHHDYSCDPYEVVDDEDMDDTADHSSESFDTYTTNYTQSPQSSRSTSTPQAKRNQKLPETELRKKRIKAFFFSHKKIPLKYNCFDLLGKNIDVVETLLYNQAFNNIKKILVKDIYVDSPYFIGQVEQVVIQGSSYFQEGDLIPYDAEIIITYHVKREISIPLSYNVLRKMNYVDASNVLRKLGFIKIYQQPIRDLVIGWIKKSGSVEKITIGDVCPFKKDSVFTYDAKIVIEYHTFYQK